MWRALLTAAIIYGCGHPGLDGYAWYRTTLPAVLFEAGVIKHRAEELVLRDPALQARMADAIATGIAACLYVPR